MPKISDHFDGRKFYNPSMEKPRSLWSLLRWLVSRGPESWPNFEHISQQKILHQRVKEKELWVTFINHSTVLIQLNGLNILTDPIWSERASPFSKLGPKRVCPPGVKFEDLPPIDFVCVSHNHYDHMDKKTLQSLQQNHQPVFLSGIGNKAYLETFGLKKVQEFDWWEGTSLGKDLTLTFVPAQHFSARGLFDRNKALWGGFFIQSPDHRIYFAGDTGYGPHFEEIQKRLGAPTLSVLPIGAFKPEWFMRPVHLSPHEAVQALMDLKSKQALAIHFGTFQLADEEFEEPVIELKQALKKYSLSLDQFWVLNPGESKKLESFLK